MDALPTALRIAELLASRLCHDLAGPLGTVSAALELAEDDAGPNGEARALAAEAADVAVKRLRLLRAAWGPAASRKIPEIRTLAGALERPNLTVVIDGRDSIVPAVMARLLLNAALLAAESLPRGGRIGISGESRAGFLVEIDGPRAAWPAELARYLVDAGYALAALEVPEPESARALQAPLTALFAHVDSLRIAMLLPAGSERAAPLLLQAR